MCWKFHLQQIIEKNVFRHIQTETPNKLVLYLWSELWTIETGLNSVINHSKRHFVVISRQRIKNRAINSTVQSIWCSQIRSPVKFNWTHSGSLLINVLGGCHVNNLCIIKSPLTNTTTMSSDTNNAHVCRQWMWIV